MFLNRMLFLLSTLIILPNAPVHAAAAVQEASSFTFLSKIGSSIKDYCKDHPIKAALIAAPIALVGFFVGGCAIAAYDCRQRRLEHERRYGPPLSPEEKIIRAARAREESERNQALYTMHMNNRAIIHELLYGKKESAVDPNDLPTEEQLKTFFVNYPKQLSEIPDHIKNACPHFIGHLDPHIYTIALQAAKNMQISEPIFFYETTSTSYASSYKNFNRIGLNLREMLGLHPTYTKTLSYFYGFCPESYPDLNPNDHKNRFYRSLYHELSHIKYKDSIRASLSPADRQFMRRYIEMRAELSGNWGAYHFHNIPFRREYPEHDDGIHPLGIDYLRYIDLLAAILRENNPDIDIPSVIESLARQYLGEIAPHLVGQLETIFPQEPGTSVSASVASSSETS